MIWGLRIEEFDPGGLQITRSLRLIDAWKSFETFETWPFVSRDRSGDFVVASMCPWCACTRSYVEGDYSQTDKGSVPLSWLRLVGLSSSSRASI